jgi:hypothetical protein
MNQPDLHLALNCPECGGPMQYIATKRSPHTWYLYACPRDGMFGVQKEGGRPICYAPFSRSSPSSLSGTRIRTSL